MTLACDAPARRATAAEEAALGLGLGSAAAVAVAVVVAVVRASGHGRPRRASGVAGGARGLRRPGLP